jgi:hypothetical protein
VPGTVKNLAPETALLEIVSASVTSRPKLDGAISPIWTPSIVEFGPAARRKAELAPSIFAAGTATASFPSSRRVNIGNLLGCCPAYCQQPGWH